MPNAPMRLVRRSPQRSGAGNLLERVKALLPGPGSTSGGGGRGAKGAGFAALAGAAAFAFKKRDKLRGLLSRNHGESDRTTPATHPPTGPPGEDPPAAA